MRRREGSRGETFEITRRHPDPQRRRGTSQLVTLYPSLCQQDPTERSLAFARDDSSASLNTWPYRAVSLSFVSRGWVLWDFAGPNRSHHRKTFRHAIGSPGTARNGLHERASGHTSRARYLEARR